MKRTTINLENYFLGKITIDDIYKLFCKKIQEEVKNDFNRKTTTGIRNCDREIS